MSDAKPSYRINEWCVEARISPSLYYKENRLGRGPLTANIGRRTLIVEAPRDFLERVRREAAESQSGGSAA
jgi:hypothetical protein